MTLKHSAAWLTGCSLLFDVSDRFQQRLGFPVTCHTLNCPTVTASARLLHSLTVLCAFHQTGHEEDHLKDHLVLPAPNERSGMVCQPAGGGPQPLPSCWTQPQCRVRPARLPSGCHSPAAMAACTQSVHVMSRKLQYLQYHI